MYFQITSSKEQVLEELKHNNILDALKCEIMEENEHIILKVTAVNHASRKLVIPLIYDIGFIEKEHTYMMLECKNILGELMISGSGTEVCVYVAEKTNSIPVLETNII